jgi:23S rRNA pseudouridine1911/1915/1917 synthase
MKRRSFTVEHRGGVAELVSDELETALAEAQALIDRGAVYLDGRRVRARVEAEVGATVMVVLEEAGSSVFERAAPPALSVLFENDDVVAVDKPSGLTAQPTPGRVGDSLVDVVSARLGFSAGLVHRLDRETSGVTIFGKTPEATSRLAEAFRAGRVTKQYLAVTAAGLAPSGTIDPGPLARLGAGQRHSRPDPLRGSTGGPGVGGHAVSRHRAHAPAAGPPHRARLPHSWRSAVRRRPRPALPAARPGAGAGRAAN